jgi:hypothetical protein
MAMQKVEFRMFPGRFTGKMAALEKYEQSLKIKKNWAID